MSNERICPACETGTVRDLQRKGRTFPHRLFADVELPANVALPECDGCGKILLSPRYAEAFDQGMTRAYQERLTSVAIGALEDLRAHVTLQDLERQTGLSSGYLSKLRGGKETSAPLATLLQLLANDPSRLEELRTSFGWPREEASPRVVVKPDFGRSRSVTRIPRADVGAGYAAVELNISFEVKTGPLEGVAA